MPTAISRAERRRQQSDKRRRQVATTVLDGAAVPTALAPMSFQGAMLAQALPRALVDAGRVRFDQRDQPRVALYDPKLLAPNPQRGRIIDRDLDVLAASVDAHGQQEPLIARLITDTDRKRWPEAFKTGQLLVILQGHRLYMAQPRSKQRMLKVELLLKDQDEDDLTYSRRALRRASIKMVHSQSYTILDKAHQWWIWKNEYALEAPKDSEAATFFNISRTEAQRLRVVADLDEKVAQDILNSDRMPGDEVVFTIANRPRDEQRDAYDRYGHLTVAGMRQALKEQEGRSKPDATISGPGRPRNYVLAVRDDEAPITYISTSLTPREWKRRGGAKAFWQAVRQLASRRDLLERLDHDLD